MVTRLRANRWFLLLGLLAGMLAGAFSFAHTAEAHAIIVSSKPAANSTLPQGAVDILLQFNSRIQIALSRLSLVDPQGKVAAVPIAAGPILGSIVAQAKTDTAGRWTLRWQVLSVDGHITRGEIPFIVVAKTTP